MIAVTLFWFLVTAIMIWHYTQARGSAYYAYSTIYFAGFSLFALVTGLLFSAVLIAASAGLYFAVTTWGVKVFEKL